MRPLHRLAISTAVLILTVLLVYGRSVRHAFLEWDDQITLVGNPAMHPPTGASWVTAWTTPRQELYVPVTYSLWTAISAIAWHPEHGLTPAPFRVTSILLHIVSALLVLMLIRLWIDSIWAALLGALLFALHPLQVESVNWISGQKDLLCGMISLGALLCHTLSAKTARRAALWLSGAAVLYALALLAKPAAVALPVAALAVDWLILRRSRKATLIIFGVGILLAVPVAIVARMVQAAALVETTPLWTRPLIAGDAIAFYLRKLILPLGLTVDYGRAPRRVMQTPTIWYLWLIPAAMALGAWLVRRRAPRVAAAVVLLIAPLLPVLGLVPFSFQIYSTVADHYLYLAMLGPALLMALAVQRYRGLLAPACLLVVVWGVMSMIQTRHWQDSESLFTHAQAVNPRSVAANNVLGYLAAGRGDSARAVELYSKALEQRPTDAHAHFNLANNLLRLNRPTEALEHYRRALELSPELRVHEPRIAQLEARLRAPTTHPAP